MASLLELRVISKKYQQQSVLNRVSFNVNKGEIFGLLGESGSGKSTLLRIAAGLIDPDEGDVWMDGKKLPLASDQLIAGCSEIKIVHQEYNLSMPLTVRENINYALRYYEKTYRDERVDELIALCHLQIVANQPAKLLSGGEKQRTAIARALAEEARVLLLDEPFAHLDLPNRHRLTQTVRSLAAQTGMACIFVTHDATDAMGLSHQMGVMHNGSLIQIDTPEIIYHQPINAYVAALTGEINWVDVHFFEHYFGQGATQTLFENKAMLRPEMITIYEKKKTKSIKAKVIESIFEGSRYRVYLQMDGIPLLAYHHCFLSKEQTVFIHVLVV